MDHNNQRKLQEQIELKLEEWLKEDHTNDQLTVTSKSDTTIIHIGQTDSLNMLLYLYLQSNTNRSSDYEGDEHSEINALHEQINQLQRKNKQFIQEIEGQTTNGE